ncbi:MAG: 3-deoxy-8-phosphooctulonate synthase [Candidatus Tectomicrobia bacterium]|uniref:2-dehydro-3-deoxyphosphooctonate aldolase n=1 Tax=Tectimicrobiota bacterium TaxID=2528274 RepID=A0A933GKQ5_UNCTE|nr:3-deoxy-8-phosphooctulonate synthase [Candidatus Tectomicrobia bacterium]
MSREVTVGKVKLGGNNELVLIAGPCVIETRDATLSIAEKLAEIARKLSVPLIFKSSYDKANRTSLSSYRGPGLDKGLSILREVKSNLGLPLLSDVHSQSEIRAAVEVVDVIQIPAFLSRQTDLIVAAASQGLTINVKKGQFLAPWDMKSVIDKIESTGNRNILLTERGVSFGYNNLVADMRSLVILREFGYPVIFDATHSVQLPGGKGQSSGGERRFVPALARAAVAVGCNGVFMEVHPDPDHALSDGPNMLPLVELYPLLETLKNIHQLIRK